MKTYGRVQLVRTERRAQWELEAVPYVMTKVKRLIARAEAHRKGCITIVDTPEMSRELLWIMDRWPMAMAEADREWMVQQRAEHMRREEVITHVLAGTAGVLRGQMEPNGTPYDYQEIAARILFENRRLLLTDELGLGKTLVALLMLRYADALPMVVVAPAHLPRQWVREMGKWFPMRLPHIARKTQVYNPAKHRSMKGQTPDVLLVTYAKLAGWADELRGVARTVVFEEAHELRVPGSQKYTAAAMIADEAEWVIGLTATPVFNYGDEIHSVLEIIRPDTLGSRSEFTREWCEYGGRKAKVSDPRALGEYLREQGAMLRRTRKEVRKELPAIVPVMQEVDCDAEVIEDAEEAVESLADLLLTTTIKLTGTERRDAAKELDWQLRRATGVAKAPHVAAHVRLVLEAEGKMLLFGWHREVYNIWMESLADLHPVMYTGSESPRQKEIALARFIGGERLAQLNAEERRAGRLQFGRDLTESPLLIMSLRSGSGVDGLQHVCHVVGIGELDWSPGQEDQCIGRLDRPGQAEPVVAIRYVTDEGSDPVILDVQGEKRQQADLIRDPDAELFALAGTSDDRMREMARHVKRKMEGRPRRAKTPEADRHLRLVT